MKWNNVMIEIIFLETDVQEDVKLKKFVETEM
jgi:hypothetical protein